VTDKTVALGLWMELESRNDFFKIKFDLKKYNLSVTVYK